MISSLPLSIGAAAIAIKPRLPVRRRTLETGMFMERLELETIVGMEDRKSIVSRGDENWSEDFFRNFDCVFERGSYDAERLSQITHITR